MNEPRSWHLYNGFRFGEGLETFKDRLRHSPGGG